ncbi:hypothetical protein RUM44_009201 [Polyplax serrata]|uniref:Uncharacterized protein n=1 Tax=Polyplax serrata TaxID=468196 RepID=A0ABR1AS10_POLSC
MAGCTATQLSDILPRLIYESKKIWKRQRQTRPNRDRSTDTAQVKGPGYEYPPATCYLIAEISVSLALPFLDQDCLNSSLSIYPFPLGGRFFSFLDLLQVPKVAILTRVIQL